MDPVRFKNYCETRGYRTAKEVIAEYDEFFKSHHGAMILQVMASRKGVSVEFIKKRLVKMKLMKKERINLDNPVVRPRIRKYNEILGGVFGYEQPLRAANTRQPQLAQQ